MNALPWVVEPVTMLGFAVRATVVLATGLVLAWLIRKDSAQSRHRLWTATLFVLLLLPPMTLWVPSWEVPLLPAGADPAPEAPAIHSTVVAVAGSPIASASGPLVTPALRSEVLAAEVKMSPRPDVPAAAAGVSSPPNPQAATKTAGGDNTQRAAHSAGKLASSSFSLSHPLLFWAIGCLASLTILAAGLLRWRMLVRKGHPVRDPLWLREMDGIARRLRLRRGVRLLVSDAAKTPMTGGVWKPVILLPASSATWDSERRKVVLMHEMVHVRRCDALRQVMRGVVLALYWFHPLAWVAARLAATSREEACDERVLQLGSRPSEYARHLLSLAPARTGSGGGPLVALSLVQQSRSRLERRIMAILRPHGPRTSALVTGAFLTVTGLLGVSTAIAHPVPREKTDAGVIPANPTVFHTIDDVETATVPVTAAARPPEASASGSTVVELDEGAGAIGATGRSAGAESPMSVSIADVPSPPRTVEMQEVSCDPPRVGPNDPRNTGPDIVGVGLLRHDGDRYAWTSVDGVRLCMHMRGDAVLEGGEIRSLAADGWIVLESEGDKLHRLIMRTGSGGFEYQWSVGGEARRFDEPAKEWRDGMLAVLGGYLEINGIQSEVADLQDQISHHRGVVSGLQGQVSHEQGVVASLQGQVSYYQGVVSGLLDQITYHQSVVAGMRDDISYHRGVVSGLRGEISMHRARVTAFQEVKSTYENQITAIIPRLKTAPDSSARQRIERSIRDWEERIQGIEAQIEAYGLGAKVRKIEDRIRNYSLDVRVRNLEQRIEAYEVQAGLQKIEAEIEEQSKLLNDVTERTEEAIRAREARIGDVQREIAAYYLDDKVARLEQQIQDLDADETSARIMQSIGEERMRILQLIRRL